MATVEIDEAELKVLRGGQRLLDNLQNSPKSRREFQRAVKSIIPDTITDEDRLKEAPEVQRLDKLEEKFNKFLDTQDKNSQDSETKEAFGRLASSGYTDEGITKIKQLMVDRKIGDPEAAAALFDKQNPPTEIPPSGFQPTNWGFGVNKDADPDTKSLFDNEDAWAEREAIKVIRGG